MDLNTIWFILVGVLLTGYAMLDGFDLGVGAIHLFARTDRERRLNLNAIGPVWDGNEVWLSLHKILLSRRLRYSVPQTTRQCQAFFSSQADR